MQRTNIYLEERQCELLDQLAAQEGVSRAQVIRRLIDRQLGSGDVDLETDVDAIAESFGVLAQMEAVARQPDDRARHLDEMWRLEP